RPLELAVGRIVFQQIRQVLGGHHVIDPHEFDVRIRNSGAKNQPTDTPETIDADFQRHDANSSLNLLMKLLSRGPPLGQARGGHKTANYRGLEERVKIVPERYKPNHWRCDSSARNDCPIGDLK